MSYDDWEGIARELLEQTGCDDGPVDALELAGLCGLKVRARCGPASLRGDAIYVDLRGRDTRRQWEVAHELGHWALRRAGEPSCERGADYVGAALLLPRKRYAHDLHACDWDLAQLRVMHPHAPWSWLARRVTHVTEAAALVWDHGHCVSRVESPWRVGARYVPTEDEAALADACLASGEPIRDGRAGAWPVFDRRWRRVVTISPL